MSSQLALPLPSTASLSRDDFIVGPGNAQAVAFVDAWPNWPVTAAALFGPPSCGKTHLAAAWRQAAGATVLAFDSEVNAKLPSGPLILEDVDRATATHERDSFLFRVLESASTQSPVLLTARVPPSEWRVVLPDLSSRLAALVALPLWKPDDALLAALARKLLADRQLAVPTAVIDRMLASLERTPESIREFIAMADQKALAEGRPVNLALVREMLAARDISPS